MAYYLRFGLGLIFSALFMLAPAFAQESDIKTDLVINDIAGHWIIEVIDRPNDDFKGTAIIPSAEGKTVMAETITEDKCCDGKNHARVLQDSRITIDDNGKITVDSTIVKYLLRKEELPIGYSADNFVLRWKDHNTLIGTANRYTKVRWVRERLNIS